MCTGCGARLGVVSLFGGCSDSHKMLLESLWIGDFIRQFIPVLNCFHKEWVAILWSLLPESVGTCDYFWLCHGISIGQVVICIDSHSSMDYLIEERESGILPNGLERISQPRSEIIAETLWLPWIITLNKPCCPPLYLFYLLYVLSVICVRHVRAIFQVASNKWFIYSGFFRFWGLYFKFL